jgi:hypothetical protein
MGLVGSEVSPVAKVVPVADVFDAVSTGRTYVSADQGLGARMPLPVIKRFMDGRSGTHFDPGSLEAFWNAPANKMITVLESAAPHPPVPRDVVDEFQGVSFGRVIEAMNNPNASQREAALAKTLQSIYSASDRI